MAPTTAGKILAERIAEFDHSIDEMVSDLRRVSASPVSIEFRLGLVDSFAGTVGPRMVQALAAHAPGLNVTVWSGLAASHAEALVRGSIDVAVTTDPMNELPDFDRTCLLTEGYVLAVPATSADAIRGLELAEVFRAFRLVRHSARSSMGAQVERHLARVGVKPRRSFEFDTSDAVLGMVASGMGVAITTPLCVAQGGAHASGVAILPLPGPRVAREIHLVTRRGEFAYLGDGLSVIARAALRSATWPLDPGSVAVVSGAFAVQDADETTVLTPDCGPIDAA